MTLARSFPRMSQRSHWPRAHSPGRSYDTGGDHNGSRRSQHQDRIPITARYPTRWQGAELSSDHGFSQYNRGHIDNGYERSRPLSRNDNFHEAARLVLPESSSSAYAANTRGFEVASSDHTTGFSEKQSTPSPSYIEATLEPSAYLDDPTSKRKLLILDLNGTLVFRSPHRRREHRPKKHDRHYQNGDRWQHSSEGTESHLDPYADPTIQRPLRSVHPRPFLSSFRQYIFHPSTRSWLDTMIWSSAQPHSVADMTERCFGDEKDKLMVIWARDTLGLDREEYHRKTQTTKDLAKPWALLSPNPSELVTPLQIHSAHSTLLLDDSPRKAHLQPWNHICIREYVSDMRSADLVAAQTVGSWKPLLVTESIEEGNEGDTVPEMDAAAPLTDTGVEVPVEEARKRKRQLKKMAKKQHQLPGDVDGQVGPGSKDRWRMFDCTLLAIVGVLDAVKQESNVASWVRKGGLWSNRGKNLVVEPHTDVLSVYNDDLDASSSAHDDRKRQRRVSAGNSELSEDRSKESGLWFEDEAVMALWIERGIRALSELDIKVDPDVRIS